MPDYFAFFGLDRKLALDAADLEKRFYRLSRELHPDRHVRSTPAERERALDASAILNDAYRTLRDPVARAEYFLKREPSDGKPDPELLEEVFDLNMALEEMKSGDWPARAQVEQARARFLGLRAGIDQSLAALFAACDSGAETDALREALDRRRYVENLIRRVEAELGTNA